METTKKELTQGEFVEQAETLDPQIDDEKE